MEQGPQAVHLDQDRRRDPRDPRRLLRTNYWVRTLGGSGFLVCADAGGPAGAGAGFGDGAAKVSLPAPAARGHGSVRALARLAAAGPRAASGTGREAARLSLILLALWPRALAPGRVAAGGRQRR